MINEKEGESEITPNAPGKIDARVVHTVRHLKQIPSRHSGDSKGSSDGSKELDSNKHSSSSSREKKSFTKNIENNKNMQSELYFSGMDSDKKISGSQNIIRSISNITKDKKKDKSGNNMRISIDGSGQSTSESVNKPDLSKVDKNENFENSQKVHSSKEIAIPNLHSAKMKKENATVSSKNTIPTNSNTKLKLKRDSTIGNTINTASKSFKFSGGGPTPFAPLKTKTEFQKRLMSDSNIQKYKTMCITMLKDDEELRKMCEFCNLLPASSGSSMFSNKDSLLDSFIEENFFRENFFLYKLETLLTSDVSKAKKEKFFKEEIKKFFEIKLLDIQYENKIKSLNFTIENHLKNIEEFQFFS
jgi:hypothetical protein